MAQLSDDCFAFGGPLLSINAAVAELRARVTPVTGVERAPLLKALGQVLAADLISPINVPAFANSAVDGYAVRHAELDPEAETVLPVQGRVAAGGRMEQAPPPRTAVRIFTGAPMPPGLDTVMMQEDAELRGDTVVLRPGLKRGANSREAGEDVRAGSRALPAGRRLRPQDIGLAASLGQTHLEVRTPLRVAVFSTGDELVDPGAERPFQALYDSNRFTLAALLTNLGCAVTDLGILRDRRDAITSALAEAAPGHDLILTSGGVSTGEEDHVKAAVEASGRLHFWRLAIKPGRPVALGQVGNTAFAGLPGNPVAVMVTFLNVVRPLVMALQGAAPEDPPRFAVRAAFDYKKKKDRREYVRVRLARAADGAWEAHKFPRDGAGILSSMVEADGLMELGEEITKLPAGTEVPFLPLGLIV
ncbi:molybdopterin molybdotransferase MoeA [Indioceanicola profundi]|uniref:molybdopterin molybdotransferase MoeA n=1 Tax=Indioceanicola profundi TaxID=2220096 RepID=UPI000E6AB3AB|nr:gephyrin-like molybdotransferase Glp [Indioceanicola profundi]